MADKQNATYDGNADSFISVGLPAYVKAVFHPTAEHYADRTVRTTKVIRYDEETGEFETQNTIYTRIKNVN